MKTNGGEYLYSVGPIFIYKILHVIKHLGDRGRGQKMTVSLSQRTPQVNGGFLGN